MKGPSQRSWVSGEEARSWKVEEGRRRRTRVPEVIGGGEYCDFLATPRPQTKGVGRLILEPRGGILVVLCGW